MRTKFSPVICFLAVIFLAVIFLGYTSAESARQIIAPDFVLKDLADKSVALKDFRGKIVLLDFWATWCPPCLKSIPELVDVQKRYKDKGVVVLGVSVDNPIQASNQYLSAFKKKYGVNYTVLRADQPMMQKYFGTLNFPIPVLFVIDKNGMAVDKHVGYAPGLVESSLKKLIK